MDPVENETGGSSAEGDKNEMQAGTATVQGHLRGSYENLIQYNTNNFLKYMHI